jgi:hypothetical protein
MSRNLTSGAFRQRSLPGRFSQTMLLNNTEKIIRLNGFNVETSREREMVVEI